MRDHPIIENLERTGFPDGKEPEYVTGVFRAVVRFDVEINAEAECTDDDQGAEWVYAFIGTALSMSAWTRRLDYEIEGVKRIEEESHAN